jgi:hypothetical protein
MQLARVRELSPHEQKLLREARQLLRRRAKPAMNPKDLFADSDPLTFEEGKSRPKLGRTQKEALTLAGAGRRPELLKEGREFDQTRLVASPLFAGRGGAQRLLEEQRPTTRDPRECPKCGVPLAGAYEQAHHEHWHEKQERPRRNPNLSQATDARLSQIHALFTSGVSESTGRLRYAGGYGAGSRDVVGRIGGVKPAIPELRHERASPQAIAAAIERGHGKVYNRVRSAVEIEMQREGFKPARKRSRGRLTVAPHKSVRPYCHHCKTQHARGEHRFHGEGSFHRTHLFSFNPLNRVRRLGPGYEVRYRRRIGRVPGNYKHEILSRRAQVYASEPGWYYLKHRSIIIATARPLAG